MRIAISGGTGLIGTALARALRARGDEALILTRGDARGPDTIKWSIRKGVSELRRLEGLDAVVHLAGEPLATRPWTPARRRILRDSRIAATDSLQTSLDRLDAPPAVWVGVGSLGRFGDRGDTWIDDDDPPAGGFLAELAVDWEAGHLAAAEHLGARGAVLRMGVVLSHEGGAFPHMVGPFKHGFGGWLGDGRQYTPWLSMDDCVGALLHLIDTDGCEGGFNGSVPDPVRNRAWCESLGLVMGKPVHTHAPKWAMRGALGELADGVFLNSMRARPRKLVESGFQFQDPEVGPVFDRLAGALGVRG